MGFVEFKIYISLKQMPRPKFRGYKFCRIQNLHISQTFPIPDKRCDMFCRIQNLHISQTEVVM